MSSLKPLNSIKATGLNSFRVVTDKYGGPAKSARFLVKINMPRGLPSVLKNKGYTMSDSIVNDLTYLCEAAEMPGRGFVNGDVRYYGPNQKIPVKTQYEDTTMTFICRSESYERQFFDDWMEYINPTNSWNFRFRNDYETTIDIMQYAEYTEGAQTGPNPGTNRGVGPAKETYRITLLNAYPLLVNPQPMTWADDQMQRIGVTFTYHKWKRLNWDAKPRFDKDLVSGSYNHGTTAANPNTPWPEPPSNNDTPVGGGGGGW